MIQQDSCRTIAASLQRHETTIGVDSPILRLVQTRPQAAVFSPAGSLLYGSLRSAAETPEEVVRPAGAELGGKARRGAVRVMSAKSGRRIVRKLVGLAPAMMAAIPRGDLGFLSLTFGRDFPKPARSKAVLKAFLLRLFRAYPWVCGVWVFEWQERDAPHFHMLVFGAGVLSSAFEAWCKANWLAVSGLGGSLEEHRLQRGAVMVGPDEDAIAALGLIPYLIKELIKSKQKIMRAGRESPGRFWGEFNRAEVQALRGEHPAAEPVALSGEESEVVMARLQALSVARMPDELLRHWAKWKDDAIQRFRDGGRYVRVGFDALGDAGAFVREGDAGALERVVRKSRRFQCSRYGFNGISYRHGRCREEGGLCQPVHEYFDRDEFEELQRVDYGECQVWFVNGAILAERYPDVSMGQIVGV